MSTNSAASKKTFIILWALCILGFWSMLPYIHYLGIYPSTINGIWKVVLLSTIQVVLFFGFVIWISFKIIPKTDLKPFPNLSRENYLAS